MLYVASKFQELDPQLQQDAACMSLLLVSLRRRLLAILVIILGIYSTLALVGCGGGGVHSRKCSLPFAAINLFGANVQKRSF